MSKKNEQKETQETPAALKTQAFATLASIAALVFFLPIFAVGVPAAARAQEETLEFQAARSARRATAYRRMVELVNRQAFADSEAVPLQADLQATLVALVQQSLEDSKQQPPLPMPAVDELQSLNDARDAAFAALYKRQIDACLDELDAELYDLEPWLREQCQADGTSSSLMNKAHTQFDRFWNEAIDEALPLAQQAVQDRQTAVTRDALAAELRRGGITAEQIEQLALHPEQRSRIAARLAVAVKRRLDDRLRRTFLQHTQHDLQQAIDRLITDALGQLDQRHPRHKTDTQAHTTRGLGRELAAWVTDVAQRQMDERRGERLLLAVESFPSTAVRIEDAALQRFDQRVAAIADTIVGEVQRGERPLDQSILDRIRTGIATDVRHHKLADSLAIFDGRAVSRREGAQPLMLDTLVAHAQAWIARPLIEQAEASPSRFDARSPAQTPDYGVLTAEVAQRVQDAGIDVASDHGRYDRRLASQAWQKVQAQLKEQYIVQIKQIRAAVAQQQVALHSPELAAATWIPTEETIRTIAPQSVDHSTLRQLAVWAEGRAPSERQVLEETWQIWRQRAHDALAAGAEAYQAQEELIARLREPFAEQIRVARQSGDSALLTREHWIDRYTEAATTAWSERAGASPAAQRHPQLFQARHQQIADIVAALLSTELQPADVEPVLPSISAAAQPESTEAPSEPAARPEQMESVAQPEPVVTERHQEVALATAKPEVEQPLARVDAGSGAGGEPTSRADPDRTTDWLVLLLTVLLVGSLGVHVYRERQFRRWRRGAKRAT